VRDYNDLVAYATHAARGAAEFIRASRRPAPGDWAEKTHRDFVTAIDRHAEALISETLLAAVPDSAIVGEELTPGARPRTEIIWIVDPLDGTTNFLHGYPECAVSIAALVGGELAAGVVHNISYDVVFSAARGLGARMAGERIHVSGVTNPALALIGTGYPFKRIDLLDRYLPQFAAVVRGTSGVRRAGSAALDLANLAAGRFDGFWELSLAPWDFAAGVLLVREAGGIVTTLDGDVDILQPGSIVAGNPALHAWLHQLLRSL
jgi:myo-inositol-1(or 4)-monophosphatase